MLKDLISCFREVQNHYEHRSKSLTKLSNAFNNTTTPPGFLASGGLDDALVLLRNYNKQAILEANKAREIEEEVIQALMGLRSDLSQKIKEIKNLSGDFKNSVEKEMESTRKSVNHLQEILGQAELDSSLTTGKHDPYLLRLAVDRQLERQIDEENYLHQASLFPSRLRWFGLANLPLPPLRRTSTWRARAGSWNPSSSARSKSRTTPTPAS